MKVTEALSKEQLDQYLLRIRLHHPDAADLTTLEAVVHGHTHSIPFENLSLTHPLAVPTNGEPAISTDQTAIFDKLVVKQRGGYCFETTQLVSAALRALGFDVYDGAARVVEGPGDPRPRQPPLLDTKAEALSGIAHTDAPTQQQQLQQEEEGLTGAGAGDPDNARRAGDPAEATEGGAVPTASSLSPDASSTTGEVAEAGNAPKHHEDESPAGEAPSAEVELAMGGLSHMVCFVRLEQQLWLVDCGFGGSAPTQPVAIDGGINIIDAAQARRHRLRRGLPGTTRLPRSDDPVDTRRAGWYLQSMSAPEEEWKDLYFFTLSEFYPADYATFNWRTSTHPDSLFVRQMVVTVPKSWGRATLLSDESGNVVLKMKRRGERSQVVQLQTEAERIAALKEHFGIVLL